jgi:lysyl-tRNA synthetase class 1
MSEPEAHDWVARTAEKVIAEASRRGAATVVCASGISPSGPIHLGNLREIMVPHLVAEGIRARGVPCDHLLSWDDYDRLRKVPAGVADDFAGHVGRPLTAVPDPCGEHSSWAEHFKAPFQDALRQLGVEIRELSQTERYTSGAYVSQVLHAMRSRKAINDILSRYRTLPGAEAVEAEPAGEYYPYRVYCSACGRDTTTITEYAEPVAHYQCICGHTGRVDLTTDHAGKLVWKVDWPMRWAYENVEFEAGGVDHSSPGSSFTVGSQIVREVFEGKPPEYLPYSFVGSRGGAKMSGSAGGAPTPGDALAILEAPILRWLYGRRKPNQAITVDFGDEVGRLYDEWDALTRRVQEDTAAAPERRMFLSATSTSIGTLPAPRHRVPFRTLASIVDITSGDDAQIIRILRDVHAKDADVELADVEPRLSCARAWVERHLPAESRTRVRDEPDTEVLLSLEPLQAEAVAMLLARMSDAWHLDELTALVYAIPKLQAGLPADAPPSPELKKSQRAFFSLLYRLLVGQDTGPRLPTLLLSIGQERLAHLLSRPSE